MGTTDQSKIWCDVYDGPKNECVGSVALDNHSAMSATFHPRDVTVEAGGKRFLGSSYQLGSKSGETGDGKTQIGSIYEHVDNAEVCASKGTRHYFVTDDGTLEVQKGKKSGWVPLFNAKVKRNKAESQPGS
jgi:hypothetical protein